jgi:hypothetical protein
MSQADDCPCPHWGYALKGRLHVDRNDQEEILQDGDAYHMAPEQTAITDEDTKFLEVALRNTGAF